MPLSRQDIDDLTPSIPPPGQDRPGDGDQRAMRLLWTKYLRSHWQSGFPFFDGKPQPTGFWQTIRQSWYVGVGLVPVSKIELDMSGTENRLTEAVRRTGYALGIVIYTSEHNTEVPRTLNLPVLNLSEQQFPVIVRQAAHTPQSIAIQKNGASLGTVPCWAKHAGIGGCITATHVVGAGTQFEIDVGGHRQSADVKLHSSPCLDATFLETDWPSPKPTIFVPLSNTNIAYGDPTAFDGIASSGTVTGRVTHFSPHPNYSGSGLPRLVFSDGIGRTGDSGAMVRINAQNAAMHLSKVTLDDGTTESRAIALEQVASNMSLDFYE